jgi:hypothetical protein
MLTIDSFGTGIGSRQVKKSLNARPEGTLLPPIGLPVDVDLNRQRLAVYFRPPPAKLRISCVTAEAAAGQEVCCSLSRLTISSPRCSGLSKRLGRSQVPS